jgi:hypothetical protein
MSLVIPFVSNLFKIPILILSQASPIHALIYWLKIV